MGIDRAEEILNSCKKMLIKDKEVDALTIEGLIALHHDACVMASAIIISEAIEDSARLSNL